jgi:hypothetical protein
MIVVCCEKEFSGGLVEGKAGEEEGIPENLMVNSIEDLSSDADDVHEYSEK